MTAQQDTDAQDVLWAEEYRPDWLYRPGPEIQRFHDDRESLRRLLRAPNQVGKTYAGAWESNRFSLENPGTVLCVMLADLENMYPEACAKIWAVIARDELHEDTHYVSGKGFYTNGRRGIRYANGSRWIFRSGKGEVMSVESYTAHAGWFDEVPQRSHFSGFLRGVATHMGPVWGTLTPIGRPVGWFRDRVEGDVDWRTSDGLRGEPASETWTQFVPELTPEECWWRSPENIAAAIAGMDAQERPQRAFGHWEGPTLDRFFTGFDADTIVQAVPSQTDPWHVGVWMDHGEGAGKEFAVLVVWNQRAMYAVDEYMNTKHTDPKADAEAIVSMLDDHNLEPWDVDSWVGDVNSAGKLSQAGESVNEMLSRALGALVGKEMDSPFRIQRPYKGPGSVEKRVRILNSALLRRQLYVHERCVTLAHCLRHFRGEEDLKHAIDAISYGATPVIENWKRPGGGNVWLRGR